MVYKFIVRTKGVIFFAVSLMAFGTFGTFLLIVSLSLAPLEDQIPEMNGAAPNGVLGMPVFWLSSILSLLIFISWIVSGIGVLHLKEWARKLLFVTMSVCIINMLINIALNIFMAQEVLAKFPTGLLVLAIMMAAAYYLGVIYFFSHPAIVRQFKFKSREY